MVLRKEIIFLPFILLIYVVAVYITDISEGVNLDTKTRSLTLFQFLKENLKAGKKNIARSIECIGCASTEVHPFNY